jgi:hypothetical protein
MIANAGIANSKLVAVADGEYLTVPGKRYLDGANDSAH